MPARSTPFQTLVHHIQSHLAPGASVQESAMMKHRLTGEEREVDVVLRSPVGEHSIVVSIECIDQSRPADTTWVEQMKTKHDHLETDRLILVSRSGFYGPALTLAATLGIRTYTPDEAIREDWMKLVGEKQVFFSRYDFTPTTIWLRLESPEGSQFVEAADGTEVRRPSNGATGTLGEVVMFALSSQKFAVPAMEGLAQDCQATIDCDFTLGDPLFAVDATAREHPFSAIRVKARVVRRTSPLPLSSLSWNGTPAAFGAADTALGKTLATFIEPSPGTLEGRVAVDGKPLELHIHPDYAGTPLSPKR
jgi:hypothetical protein